MVKVQAQEKVHKVHNQLTRSPDYYVDDQLYRNRGSTHFDIRNDIIYSEYQDEHSKVLSNVTELMDDQLERELHRVMHFFRNKNTLHHSNHGWFPFLSSPFKFFMTNLLVFVSLVSRSFIGHAERNRSL